MDYVIGLVVATLAACVVLFWLVTIAAALAEGKQDGGDRDRD